jgi:hypothetical protein
MGLICYISRPLTAADDGLDTFAEQLLRTKHLLSIQAITGTVFAAQGNLEVSEKGSIGKKRCILCGYWNRQHGAALRIVDSGRRS